MWHVAWWWALVGRDLRCWNGRAGVLVYFIVSSLFLHHGVLLSLLEVMGLALLLMFAVAPASASGGARQRGLSCFV